MFALVLCMVLPTEKHNPKAVLTPQRNTCALGLPVKGVLVPQRNTNPKPQTLKCCCGLQVHLVVPADLESMSASFLTNVKKTELEVWSWRPSLSRRMMREDAGWS